MTLLLTLLSLFLVNTGECITIEDNYSGIYTYALNTPAGPVDGAIVILKGEEEYTGTLTAYGKEYEIKDMVWDGPNLTFKTDAAGYKSTVIGAFEDGVYKGTIHVEGMQIPIKALKK